MTHSLLAAALVASAPEAPARSYSEERRWQPATSHVSSALVAVPALVVVPEAGLAVLVAAAMVMASHSVAKVVATNLARVMQDVDVLADKTRCDDR